MLRRGHEPDALRLLADLLREPTAADAFAAIPSTAADVLVDLARAHGVEAWLAAVAPREDTWRALAEQRPRFAAARARAVGDLRELGAVLAAIDCPWAVLKGQAVAEDVYPKPHLRFGVDIDVLVPPERFAAVIDALTAAGWTLLDRNWPLFLQTVPGELRLRAPSGGLLDLHWHLLAGIAHRASFRLPTAEQLARRRILPSGLPALDPADQLVHLAVHATLSGATRLSWLLDVHLATRAATDWPAVLATARRARACLALELVRMRAERWLGPLAVRPATGPAWRALCRAVDRRSPLGPRPDEPSAARAFARSVRATTAASLVEFARHGTGWLRAGAARTRAPLPVADAHDRRSPLYAVDDDAARQRYFELVAANRSASTAASSGACS